MEYLTSQNFKCTMIEQYQRVILSKKAQKVLANKLDTITDHGAQILNHGLERALRQKNGIALAVTDDEITGCYEIIEHVLLPINER